MPIINGSVKMFHLANTNLVPFTFVCTCNCSHIDTILVFMSPETLQVREWRSVLSGEMFSKQVVVVAVDEVHCISEWFRVRVMCSLQRCHSQMRVTVPSSQGCCTFN